MGIAYLLAFGFGILGAHRFYLEERATGTVLLAVGLTAVIGTLALNVWFPAMQADALLSEAYQLELEIYESSRALGLRGFSKPEPEYAVDPDFVRSVFVLTSIAWALAIGWVFVDLIDSIPRLVDEYNAKLLEDPNYSENLAETAKKIGVDQKSGGKAKSGW